MSPFLLVEMAMTVRIWLAPESGGYPSRMTWAVSFRAPRRYIGRHRRGGDEVGSRLSQFDNSSGVKG